MMLPFLLLQATTAPVTGTTPVTTSVATIGDSVRASLTVAFAMMFSAIPRVLGFIIILLVGWLFASIVGKAVLAILRAVKFNEISERIGIAEFVRKMGDAEPSMLIAGVVKWLIRIVVLLVAFDALGLTGVSDLLRQLLLWIPNLIVGIVVLVLAGIGARALGNVVRGASAEAGFDNPETLANVARTAVWVFAIIITVNQLGIAATLINTLVIGAVGAVSLAAGLAFGLGGRELAGSVLENWYGKAQAVKPKVERAASAAERMPPGR